MYPIMFIQRRFIPIMPVVSSFIQFFKSNFLGPAYLLFGYNITSRLLIALKSRSKFFTSENFRRLPEDIIFTGEIREEANIPVVNIDGIEYDGVIFFVNKGYPSGGFAPPYKVKHSKRQTSSVDTNGIR